MAKNTTFWKCQGCDEIMCESCATTHNNEALCIIFVLFVWQVHKQFNSRINATINECARVIV